MHLLQISTKKIKKINALCKDNIVCLKDIKNYKLNKYYLKEKHSFECNEKYKDLNINNINHF